MEVLALTLSRKLGSGLRSAALLNPTAGPIILDNMIGTVEVKNGDGVRNYHKLPLVAQGLWPICGPLRATASH